MTAPDLSAERRGWERAIAATRGASGHVIRLLSDVVCADGACSCRGWDCVIATIGDQVIADQDGETISLDWLALAVAEHRAKWGAP